MASLGYVKSLCRWRVRWRATNRKANNNRIFQGSRIFDSKAEAVGFYAAVEEQERLWRKGHVPGQVIIEILKDFYRYAQRFTKRTRIHYKMVLGSFVRGLPVDLIWIQQIKPEHIREYLARMLDRDCKNRTCNAHLTAIKSFCKYIYENFELRNPAAKVHMFKEDPPDARFLTKEEYKSLLDAATPLTRDRLLFLTNTGLRANEFAELKPDCANEDMTAITITGKGRKRRTIPLNEVAREIFPRIRTATPNALYLQFSRLAKKVGIPMFGPHAMRHRFATQLLLAGIPIAKISIVMGHASIKTTEQRYAHILPTDLQGITDVLCEDEPIEQTRLILHKNNQAVFFGIVKHA